MSFWDIFTCDKKREREREKREREKKREREREREKEKKKRARAARGKERERGAHTPGLRPEAQSFLRFFSSPEYPVSVSHMYSL